jgi:hypothetical protein
LPLLAGPFTLERIDLADRFLSSVTGDCDGEAAGFATGMWFPAWFQLFEYILRSRQQPRLLKTLTLMIFSIDLIYLILASLAVLSKLADASKPVPA